MAISAITGLISATGAAIAAGGMAIGAFIKTAVAFTALGAVSRALLAPSGEIPTLNTGGAGGTTVSVKNSVATRRLIYGKTRVGGTIVYSGSSGDDNEYLWQAYALADTAYKTTSAPYNPTPALNDLVSVYFDDELVATYSGGTFTFQPDWRLSDVQTNVSPYVSIYFYDGSQTINAGIDHSEWTSDHELRGIAYVAIRFVYDQDRYINGLPNVSFVVEGRKVYDPRKDSTSSYYDSSLGVSSHREDNPVTWQYSENPVLCLLDYMRDPVYGLGEPMSSFVSLGLAIDDCEDNVNLSSSIQNVPRYKCGGVIDSGNKIATNIENILSSMAGKLYYSQGRYRIKPLVDTTVAQATVITEDMMIGAVKLATRTSRRNQYNIVKGKFNDEDANYIATDYPAKTISTYKTADGADLALDVDLPLTTNQHRAQAIAYSLLKKSRNQATINLRLNLSAYRYDIGDIVKVTYSKFGYVEKTFEIQHLQLIPDPELGIYVDITAVEDDPSQYTYDTSTAVTRITPSIIHVTQGRTVNAPDDLSVDVLVTADDAGNVSAKLEITLADSQPDPFVTHYQFHVYKIPSFGATGHENYIASGLEFTLDKFASVNRTHTIDLPFNDLGIYRVTCEAVNIQGRHSTHISDEYEITVSERENITVSPDTTNYYTIQQSTSLTQPTLEQMEIAKGASPKHGDEFVYQQLTNGVIVDSKILEYVSQMRIWYITSFSNHKTGGFTRYGVFNSRGDKMEVLVQVFVRLDPTNTNTPVLTVTEGAAPTFTDSYSWSDVGTVTIAETDAEINALADVSTHGSEYALPENYRREAIFHNNKTPRDQYYAFVKFELDAQYLNDGNDRFVVNDYTFTLTQGSDIHIFTRKIRGTQHYYTLSPSGQLIIP
jgi:hypothetical protein